MSKLLPPTLGLGLGIALAAALGGCRTIKADAPVEGAAEACCTTADFELKNFKGCRIPGRHCNGEEKFWMRGNVVCGTVDEAQCEGGRCCSYRPVYDPGVGQSVSPDDATATEPASTEPARPGEPSEPPTSKPSLDTSVSMDAPPGTVDEQIAFYEEQLEKAQRLLEARQKFVDRLPEVKAQLEASEDPEVAMVVFEERKQLAEESLARAKLDVAELEAKLAALRER